MLEDAAGRACPAMSSKEGGGGGRSLAAAAAVGVEEMLARDGVEGAGALRTGVEVLRGYDEAGAAVEAYRWPSDCVRRKSEVDGRVTDISARDIGWLWQ